MIMSIVCIKIRETHFEGKKISHDFLETNLNIYLIFQQNEPLD